MYLRMPSACRYQRAGMCVSAPAVCQLLGQHWLLLNIGTRRASADMAQAAGCCVLAAAVSKHMLALLVQMMTVLSAPPEAKRLPFDA